MNKSYSLQSKARKMDINAILQGEVYGERQRMGQMWVNWVERIVSFHEEADFEELQFETEESRMAQLRMFLTEGFRFQ